MGTTEKIVAQAQANGTRVIAMVPVRNLRDIPPNPDDDLLPPLSSSEAREILSRAEPTATESFRLAKYLDSAGNTRLARLYFERASDATTRVGRIHSRSAAFIRDLDKRLPGLISIDTERVAEKLTGHPILGYDVMVDWCHPELKLDYQIAAMIAGSLEREFTARFGKPAGPVPDFEAARRDAATNLAEALAIGKEEGGFVNFHLGFYRRARGYFMRRLEVGYSLKSALGLYLADLRIGKRGNLAALRETIRRRSSAAEVADFLKDYYPGASRDEKSSLDRTSP